MLWPFLALDVSPGHPLCVALIAFLSVPPPQRLRVAPVGVVGLYQDILLLLLLLEVYLDVDGQPLVVAPGDALELVHLGESGGGDGVELAGDAVGAAGEIEEKGNAIGPADEGERVEGAAGAEEEGVPSGDEGLQEGVIGESLFESAVDEYVEGRFGFRHGHHLLSFLPQSRKLEMSFKEEKVSLIFSIYV